MSNDESKTGRGAGNRQTLQDALWSIAYQSDISRRSALKGVVALAASAVLFGLPREAAAASATQETLDALSDAQARYDEVQSQIDQISADYQALSEQQAKTLQDMEDTQDQIDALQEQIDQKQEELEEKQAYLAERVASSYKGGGSEALALLLSSGSFEELISNAYYIDKVNESDRRAIEEVRRIQEELAEQRDQLQSRMDELEELKAEQTRQLEEMQAKQAEAQDLLNNLDGEVRDLIAKRDAEILESARAEAAAAEEARRQQQAASGGGGYIPEVGSGQDYNASSSAQKRIVNACYATPSPGYGLCAAWVSRVFQRAGFGYVGGNACDMYSRWCTSSKKGDLQVGMIVAVSTHSHTSAGRIWGHVGIYIGDNRVMENIGYINTNGLDSWCSYYGTTVAPRWGWASGINLAAQ